MPDMATAKPRKNQPLGRSSPMAQESRAVDRGATVTMTPTLAAVVKVRAMFSIR